MKTILLVLLINIGFLLGQEPSKEIAKEDFAPSQLLYERKTHDSTIVTQYSNDIEIVGTNPQWDWVTKVVKTGTITPNAYANTTVDSFGNTYITNYAPTNHDIDVYLAKFNNKGKMQWETLMGGEGWDSGHDLAFDKEGNIWIVGYFTESAKFGTITLTGDNKYNMFLAKVDTNGVCKNAFKVASDNSGFSYSNGTIGNGQLGGFSIFITNSNEIILSGEFEKKLSFGKIHLTSNRPRSTFFAKFDSLGICNWGTIGESSNWCYSSIAHYSKNGDVYFQSTCADTLFVGDKSLGNANNYDSDMLMAKINSSGKCEWIKRINYTSTSDKSNSSSNLKDNELFYVHASPDNVKKLNAQYVDMGNRIWLTEINTQGELIRNLPLGNNSNDGEGVIWGFTRDSEKNIYVIGTFNGDAYFGDTKLSTKENTRGTGFVAKYRFDGKCEWAKVINCDGKIIWLRSVKVVGNKLFLSGNYQLRADFDNFRIETNEQNTNVNEIFLAKLNLN